MALLFVDRSDNEGRIFDDLSVEYDGREPVEEYVEAVAKEADSTEEALENVIIDMNGDLDVREVRRLSE